MQKPLDHTFAFSLIGLLPIIFVFLFKRSWLNDPLTRRRIGKVCLFVAAVGLIAFCLSPRHLECLFLLIPIYQFAIHDVMLARFQRRHQRVPFFPPRWSWNPAYFPDFTFNTVFLILTTAAMMPVLGIIFAQLQKSI